MDPCRLLAGSQITSTSGLLLTSQPPASVPGFPPTLVWGPSKCNEAARLDLRYEGTASRVQWRRCCPERLTLRVPEVGANWPALLQGKDWLWGEVTCGEWGDTLNLQYSFLIKLASLSFFFCFRGWRKRRLGSQTPPPEAHGTCHATLPTPRGFCRSPMACKG